MNGTLSTVSAGGAASMASCCSHLAATSAVPQPIYNPPGLSAIRYRIGTFTSFRRAMLDQVAAPDLMTSAVTTLARDVKPSDTVVIVLDASAFPPAAPFRIRIESEYFTVIGGAGTTTWKVERDASATGHVGGTPVWLDALNPFASWREGIGDDYQTTFVELWAYLADVLTFYQERIANEVFLGTATQRDSLLQIVSLIGYRPSPGAAATGVVAFKVAKDRSVTIPAGFRVGSRAQPGRPAVVFETTTTITATADNSSIPLSVLSPSQEFQKGQVVLQGTVTRLAINDYLLAVENLDADAESPHLLQVTDVSPDNGLNTTTVSWLEVPASGSEAPPYVKASKQVAIYALRVVATPFGSRAPLWSSLPDALKTSSVDPQTVPPYPNWDVQQQPSAAGNNSTATNSWYFVPTPSDPKNQLFLDAAYDQLKYSAQNNGWAVVLTDNYNQIARVTDSRQVGKVAYAASSKVTRLTLEDNVQIPLFPLRSTTILTGSEQLAVQSNLPMEDAVSGTTLILSGVHTELQDGQQVVLRGNLNDQGAANNISAAELRVLKGVPVVDTVNNVTVVSLKQPLTHAYSPAACSLMANIVEVTQGETVKDEVLGGGDGSAFQSYSLKQTPLTYLPSTDPGSLSAVTSTLSVAVNGVAWSERTALVDSAPQDQVFTTMQDDSGRTTVMFGDGFNGARPSTGRNNIHAHYRRGLGSPGNLSADGIQKLVDGIPGLQGVTNPMPSSGGADAGGPADIRARAPASLRTFNRAVSAPDYAALALTYPGIAKASASWVLRDPTTAVALAHPYVRLTLAAVGREPLKGSVLAGKLRQFLDLHRDPNVLLRIQDYTPVYVTVEVKVEIDDRFPHDETLNRVRAALNPGINSDGSAGFFAFERLQFGQTVYLSALYAAVQSVSGVLSATVITLRRVGLELSDLFGEAPSDIVVGPTEIITIDPSAVPISQLLIHE